MELRPGSAESVGMSRERVQHLSGLGQRLVDEGVVSALVTLVARRGTIVLDEAFGQLDPSRDDPPRQDTLFPWGSASSLFT